MFGTREHRWGILRPVGGSTTQVGASGALEETKWRTPFAWWDARDPTGLSVREFRIGATVSGDPKTEGNAPESSNCRYPRGNVCPCSVPSGYAAMAMTHPAWAVPKWKHCFTVSAFPTSGCLLARLVAPGIHPRPRPGRAAPKREATPLFTAALPPQRPSLSLADRPDLMSDHCWRIVKRNHHRSPEIRPAGLFGFALVDVAGNP